jgi:prohibitin 2
VGTFLMLLTLLFVVIAAFRSVSVTRAHGRTDMKIHPFRPLPFIGLAVVTFVLFLSFVTVDAGSIGVVKKFGNPVGQISPGAHLILPWEDVSPVAVQTRVVKPNTQSSTHDLQVVTTQVTLQYHVDPDYATFILVNINNDAEARIINPAILEAIKAVTAKYDAQQLINQRTQVRDDIENLVKGRISPYHLIAENTSITDLEFSKDYNDTIEQKQVAQQNAEKAANDLKRIQIEAQQKIAAAEGEAQALKSQKEQITPELLQLRTIEMMREKWDGKLPENYVSTGSNGGALPMFDVLAGNKKK